MDLPKKVIVYNDFRKVSRWWIIPAEAYKSSNWQKETSNSLLWLPWNPLGCHFSLMDVRKNMSTTRYQTGGATLHSGCLILRLLRRCVVAPSCNYILVFCCIVARILLSENEISREYFEVLPRYFWNSQSKYLKIFERISFWGKNEVEIWKTVMSLSSSVAFKLSTPNF